MEFGLDFGNGWEDDCCDRVCRGCVPVVHDTLVSRIL